MTKGRGVSAAAVLLAATIGMTACSPSGDLAGATTSAVTTPGASSTSPNTTAHRARAPRCRPGEHVDNTDADRHAEAVDHEPVATSMTPTPSPTSPKPCRRARRPPRRRWTTLR